MFCGRAAQMPRYYSSVVEPRDRDAWHYGNPSHMIQKYTCIARLPVASHFKNPNQYPQQTPFFKSSLFEFEFKRRYSASMEVYDTILNTLTRSPNASSECSL
jgi:hypothetical protein